MKVHAKLNLNSKLLPILFILVGTIFFFISDPPQSPCGAQIDTYKKSLKGKLYSYKVDKNIIPSAIKKTSDFCRQGKSLGSCIDYFEIVNSMMNNLNQLDTECFSELLNEKEFIENLKRYFSITVLLAWGDKVPEETKTGWLSESNILVFCKVKNFLEANLDPDDNETLKNKLLASLPYSKLGLSAIDNSEELAENKAINKLGKEKVLEKSLLSVRCERYF